MAELEKNAEFVWMFKMVDSTDFATAETGETCAVTFSHLAAGVMTAFTGLTGSPAVTQVSAGWYYVTVPAADMNADVVVLRATGDASAPTEEKLYPPTKIVSDLNDFDAAATNVTHADAHLTSAKIADSFAEKITDILVRRSYNSIRTSSDGDAVSFRSLLGAVARLVNKIDASSGTTLVTYHEDDSTAFETSAVTGDSGADPVVTIDPS